MFSWSHISSPCSTYFECSSNDCILYTLYFAYVSLQKQKSKIKLICLRSLYIFLWAQNRIYHPKYVFKSVENDSYRRLNKNKWTSSTVHWFEKSTIFTIYLFLLFWFFLCGVFLFSCFLVFLFYCYLPRLRWTRIFFKFT